jgi:hypothetical protein
MIDILLLFIISPRCIILSARRGVGWPRRRVLAFRDIAGVKKSKAPRSARGSPRMARAFENAAPKGLSAIVNGE